MDLGLYILRLTRLFRQRPSRRWLIAVIGVAILVALCLLLEALGWWPEWASVERGPRLPLR